MRMIEAMPHGRKEQMDEDLKTITLSGRDLRAATRLLNLILGTDADRGPELRMTKATGPHDRAILLGRARQEFVARAQRSQIFNRAMFGEPAWDMLLALYLTEQTGARHTVSGLINLSGVPPTTALRWLDFLENNEHLVIRKPNSVDKRVFLIELTEKARDALDAYFSGTASTGT